MLSTDTGLAVVYQRSDVDAVNDDVHLRLASHLSLLFRRVWSYIWQRPVSIASCLIVGLFFGIALVIVLSLIPIYLSARSVDERPTSEFFDSWCSPFTRKFSLRLLVALGSYFLNYRAATTNLVSLAGADLASAGDEVNELVFVHYTLKSLSLSV